MGIALLSLALCPVAGSCAPSAQDTFDGNAFAFRLLRETVRSDGSSSVFVSPFSASMALTAAANGAEGHTLQQMSEVLGFDALDLDGINGYYKQLADRITSDSDVVMEIANSLWVSDQMKLRNPYMRKVRKGFGADVFCRDFSLSSVPEEINSWCSDKTEGKIDRIIENISPADMLYILNAVYFNGNWTKPFDKAATVTKDFHAWDGSVQKADMMRQTSEFPYYSDDGLSMVELPYGEKGNFVMDLILPDEGISIEEVLENLDASTFSRICTSMSCPKVCIELPKMELEYDINLNSILQGLGMKNAFTSAADFSGMSRIPLMISQVRQKTYLKVDEKGTEAAAVTAVSVMKASVNPEPPVRFTADRPFILIIRETCSGTVLFAGAVKSL